MADTMRADACAAVENAIATLAEYLCDSDDMVTDAVIVLGAQAIDEDGDRIGRVVVFPRHGSQPPYITLGLLDEAARLIRQANDKASDD
jgi:hypothetical protein